MTEPTNIEGHLPKQAPKKTGSRGIKPLDPVEDFDNPVRVEAEAEQGELLPGTEEASTPQTPRLIQNDKMLTQFVRPHFEREEGGDRYVGFELMIALTPAHEEKNYLPSLVVGEWRHMREGNSKRIDVIGVEPQTISVGLVPDDPEHDLILVAATVEKPVLAVIEDTGTGKAQKMIRLTFRAVVGQEESIAKFAVDHHGEPVWVSMIPTQGNLL